MASTLQLLVLIADTRTEHDRGDLCNSDRNTLRCVLCGEVIELLYLATATVTLAEQASYIYIERKRTLAG